MSRRDFNLLTLFLIFSMTFSQNVSKNDKKRQIVPNILTIRIKDAHMNNKNNFVSN